MSFVSDIHWEKKLEWFGVVIVDECMEYDTLINTDIWKIKIWDIVTKKIDCNILSYNKETKQNEYKRLIWIKEEKEDERELYEIQTKEWKIICTWWHLLFTTNRWRIRADDLTIKDDLIILTTDID
jgi:hypothetical protein